MIKYKDMNGVIHDMGMFYKVGGDPAYIIIAAELPNVTLSLYNASGSSLSSKSTGVNGGRVEFEVTSTGTYTVKAIRSDGAEIWTNTVDIMQAGVYNCKTGKPLNDYTWDEIVIAAEGHYAQYMWSVDDYKDLPRFMGSTSSTYIRARIMGFDHDDLVGGGKAGITFGNVITPSSYSHFATNVNGISWLGSNIRLNCLKAGESTYIYDDTVTAETVGTFYVYNVGAGQFDTVTLPDDYISTSKYYKMYTATEDGAFITGFPVEVLPYVKQVTKKTWTGWGGTVTSSTSAINDNTILETHDWLFLPSDSEVFGDENRFKNYSKYALEGTQYDRFKDFRENLLASGNSCWFRSPYVSSATGFACWIGTGYVSFSNASNAYRAFLCFCI